MAILKECLCKILHRKGNVVFLEVQNRPLPLGDGLHTQLTIGVSSTSTTTPQSIGYFLNVNNLFGHWAHSCVITRLKASAEDTPKSRSCVRL